MGLIIGAAENWSWPGRRPRWTEKRPAVRLGSAGGRGARRSSAATGAPPQSVTSPGAHNSGAVDNSSAQGAAPSGGVIAQLEKHDMPYRYLVVTQTEEGVTRHLVVDTAAQFGAPNRVIASGAWADPIREIARLANEAADIADAAAYEAELVARLEAEVAQ